LAYTDELATVLKSKMAAAAFLDFGHYTYFDTIEKLYIEVVTFPSNL